MRSFVILLSLQCISNGVVVGFSSPAVPTSSRSLTSSLFAINNDDNINSKKDSIGHQLRNKVASIAATFVFGLTIGTTSSIAYDSYPSLSNKDITVSNNMLTSSSVQVSYSNSDFVDFSLPSYQDVAAAEINSNLSGGKDLLDDKYKTMSPSSSSGSSADSTPAKKEPTKADIMTEKAAAKAAQAAARERQKAAADAAALDKMIGI